jgi:hypothetical protein
MEFMIYLRDGAIYHCLLYMEMEIGGSTSGPELNSYVNGELIRPQAVSKTWHLKRQGLEKKTSHSYNRMEDLRLLAIVLLIAICEV